LAPNAILPLTKIISAFTRLKFQDIEGIKKCDGKVAKSSTIAGLRLKGNIVKLSLIIRLQKGNEITLFLELNSHSLRRALIIIIHATPVLLFKNLLMRTRMLRSVKEW
jgi:hypothetical protein